MLLADFGAEVIKVESPKGDPVRMYPPFLDNQQSAYHFAFNRNKKSLSLDLQTVRGKDIFFELCEKADVLVESFRPGVTGKMGIDYETVEQYNDRLIYCSITGYGQDSSMGTEPGHDINFLSLSGVLNLCGLQDKPVLPGIQVGDVGGGSFPAFSSILLALLAREKSGKGQHIDCSMTDSMFFYLPVIMAEYWALDLSPGRGEFILSGNRANYSIYETRDHKFISVGALEEKFWRRVTEKLGRPDWGNDYFEVVQDPDYRKKVADIILTKTRDEWMDLFSGSGCCVTPVHTIPEAEQFMQSRMVSRVSDYKVIGNPLKLSKNPPNVVKRPAPDLGQDTEVLLTDLLDYTEQRIEELKNDGIIHSP